MAEKNRPRLLRRIALGFALVTIALLGSLLALPLVLNSFLELKSARNTVAGKIKESLGRAVHLDGDIRFQLYTLTPGFRVENVRLGNAEWAAQKDMLRLRHMDIELALLPLLTS